MIGALDIVACGLLLPFFLIDGLQNFVWLSVGAWLAVYTALIIVSFVTIFVFMRQTVASEMTKLAWRTMLKVKVGFGDYRVIELTESLSAQVYCQSDRFRMTLVRDGVPVNEYAIFPAYITSCTGEHFSMNELQVFGDTLEKISIVAEIELNP
jgi:hypothetical protein